MGTKLFGAGEHLSAGLAATVATGFPIPWAPSWQEEGWEGLFIHLPAQTIAADCCHGPVALSPRKRRGGEIYFLVHFSISQKYHIC